MQEQRVEPVAEFGYKSHKQRYQTLQLTFRFAYPYAYERRLTLGTWNPSFGVTGIPNPAMEFSLAGPFPVRRPADARTLECHLPPDWSPNPGVGWLV